MTTVALKDGGYARLEQDIEKIENLARDGAYTSRNTDDMVSRFQQIVAEARNLRRALREVLLMVPDPHPAATSNKGAAA